MFEGVYTALVTPFKNGKIDEKALRDLVEFQIQNGIHGLVPCGSTGEAVTMSADERFNTIHIVVSQAKKRVPVLAGAGSNNTKLSIDFTQEVKHLKADGALIVTPYYNKPTQEGLFQHYKTIAKQTSFPICVYNVPGRTAVNLLPSTCHKMLAIKEIKAIKEASGNIQQISDIIEITKNKWTVLSGDDPLLLPCLSIGAKGLISVASNVVPKEIVSMYDDFKNKKLDSAMKTHHRLSNLIATLFIETNPIPVKTALSMMGMIKDDMRLPLTSMSLDNKSKLKSCLKELRLL